MKIAIIGKSGDLARSLQERLSTHNEVTCYGKDVINFADPVNVTIQAPMISENDVVIICSGTMSGNINKIMKVNALGPIHLLDELTRQNCKAHVIVIGSHAATWTSWPGVSLDRLSYNIAKKCLMDYVLGLEQSDATDMRLTLFNVSRFQSVMSNYTGRSMDEVLDKIMWLVEQEHPPLVLECGKPDADQ